MLSCVVRKCDVLFQDVSRQIATRRGKKAGRPFATSRTLEAFDATPREVSCCSFLLFLVRMATKILHRVCHDRSRGLGTGRGFELTSRVVKYRHEAPRGGDHVYPFVTCRETS